MINLTLAVQTIKDSVSAIDVANVIGLNVDKHGRCSCPFHNGKDRNMKLFPGNKGYTCFVCHESGDVIRFAQKYYDTSFRDTISWFNDSFHLGIDLESKIDRETARQAEIALQRRKEAQAFEEWKKRMRFDLFLTADKIMEMLEDQRDRFAPKTPDETWHPKFCEAIRLLPTAKRFALDCIEEKR